jgi:predicted nucleic acid-binding protein
VVVVDASVWISVLIASDANHAASRAWMRQWVDDGKTFVLPLLILPEVAGGVARRTNLPDLGDAAVASILRGADAVYTALAERQALPLVTWDGEQLTRAAGRIRVLRPAV